MALIREGKKVVPAYLRPDSVTEALDALKSGAPCVIAGGTDFYPARVGRTPREDVLDISALADLRGITETDEHWRFGALTTWTDVVGADLPPVFDVLRQAARTIGGAQIQNVATLCGNLCNASPAADGVPALLCLDAEVELSSADGVARMPLGDFIIGNRRTALRADQLMTAVLVPKTGAARAASRFLKLGAREYLVISIAMVAVAIEAGADGAVTRARVAVGACSEVAQRLGALEATLVGRALDAALGEAVEPAHLANLSPIDDMRASAAYRRDAALILVRRALSELGAAP